MTDQSHSPAYDAAVAHVKGKLRDVKEGEPLTAATPTDPERAALQQQEKERGPVRHRVAEGVRDTVHKVVGGGGQEGVSGGQQG